MVSDTHTTPWSTWVPPEPSDTALPAPTCEQWCGCLVDTCTALPQVDTAFDCMGYCADLSERERTCWTAYCEQAATVPLEQRRHLCEHAAGLEGLYECK